MVQFWEILGKRQIFRLRSGALMQVLCCCWSGQSRIRGFDDGSEQEQEFGRAKFVLEHFKAHNKDRRDLKRKNKKSI